MEAHLKVLSDEHTKEMKKFIQQSWESEDIERFPGPQPVSIERRHFPLLRRQPYFVCEKTDGTRYMLVCFTAGATKVCAITDRAFKAYYLSLTVPRDTVLDGELVQTKEGKLWYMVYDSVMVKGEDTRKMPLTERLARAQAVVKGIIKSPKNQMEVRVKEMVPLECIKNMPDLDSFPYETDGIVLTPVIEPVRVGTHETMFKWKPRDRITIDFSIQHWNPTAGWELCVQDKGQFYTESSLYPPSTLKGEREGTIVECGYGDKGWYVVKIRTDKTYPNTRRTYFRTLTNIREDIQLKEFLKVL
jgi:mRNA capping enzyme, catalytic domain/mRNA capping enzyme, C-terminal domain